MVETIAGKGGRAIRFDTDRYPTDVRLTACYGSGTGERLTVAREAGEFDLREVMAIWHRRLDIGAQLPVSTGNYSTRHSAKRMPPLTVCWPACAHASRLAVVPAPGEFEEKLLRLMDYFSLNSGAIDIILTPDNRHVFLELNPGANSSGLSALPAFPSPRQSQTCFSDTPHAARPQLEISASWTIMAPARIRFPDAGNFEMIDPFQCTRCNGVLVVVDAPTVVCRFCGAVNEVPAAYREELRLSRDLDQTTRRAIAEWAHLDQIKVPRWWFAGTAIIPFLLLAGGLAILLTLGMLKRVSSSNLAWLAAIFVWLPLAPAALLASRVGMRNLLVTGAARIGVAFAAMPSASEAGELNCRQCGAPLTVAAGDILVRCLYCEAESIVRLDAAQMQLLKKNVGTAKMSLAQAMTALSKHAELAAIETRGRVYVIAGLLVLPVVWSFASAVQISYWSFLIALDVFVLSLCVFWMLREAFLPPVTVEELDALRATKERSETVKRAAGTRGWYDGAFEKVNYLVPLLVTLMFVAIEVIVC